MLLSIFYSSFSGCLLAVFSGCFGCTFNGHQNFRNWETMRRDLTHPDAHWTRTERGVFECDADYWAKSGGILEPMPRYEKMYERLQG